MSSSGALISLIPFEQGIFYALGQGHALTGANVGPGTFSLGAQLKLNSMVAMYPLLHEGVEVGFWFYSAFKVQNKGGVLVAYLENKRGKALTSRLLLRHTDVLVFELDTCGVMAISPLVNDNLTEILKEQ